MCDLGTHPRAWRLHSRPAPRPPGTSTEPEERASSRVSETVSPPSPSRPVSGASPRHRLRSGLSATRRRVAGRRRVVPSPARRHVAGSSARRLLVAEIKSSPVCVRVCVFACVCVRVSQCQCIFSSALKSCAGRFKLREPCEQTREDFVHRSSLKKFLTRPSLNVPLVYKSLRSVALIFSTTAFTI